MNAHPAPDPAEQRRAAQAQQLAAVLPVVDALFPLARRASVRAEVEDLIARLREPA